MKTYIVTKNDMTEFRAEILQEIQNIIEKEPKLKKWLKSHEVKEILRCSDSTLQNLRANGTLKYSRIGGTVYYPSDAILELFENELGNNKVDEKIMEIKENEQAK